MSDIEDQLRRYAGAASRAQLPVELDEIVSRERRHVPRRGLVSIAAAVVVVAMIGGVVALKRDHSRRIVVAPGPSSSTAVATRACPAASLHVTSVKGEYLHAGWLPPGFVKAAGDEHQPGDSGNLAYTTTGTLEHADDPHINLLRYKTDAPLTRTFQGTSRPAVVQGHEGIVSIRTFDENLRAVAWRPDAGTALVITGWKMSEADLLRVAEGVQYEPGTPFTYPTDPDVTVTREQALETLPGANHGKRVVLTSLGEVDEIARHEGSLTTLTTLVPDVPVIAPVWVVWAPTVLDSLPRPWAGMVIDARSGATIANLSTREQGGLRSLTDRSVPGCAPPFGVLTRTEAEFLRPTPIDTSGGLQSTWKLTTQGALDATSVAGYADCELHDCDPTVPVWVNIQTADNGRFIVRHGPGPQRVGDPPPATIAGPSWTSSALDARTGPQSTYLAGPGYSAGAPDSDLLDLPDLAPPT